MASSSTTRGGFCYSDHSINPAIQIQAYDSNSEIYNFTSGKELVGFSKTLHHHHQSQGLIGSTSHDHRFDSMTGISDHTITTSWQNQDSSLFVDGSSNMRPSQGLSLSLSSTNPSSLTLQSFGVIGHQRSINQEPMNQDGSFLKATKYLGPAQELLNEFCGLGTQQSHDTQKQKPNKLRLDDDIAINGSSSSRKQPISSIEFMELQKRKTKLLSMLDEVDRRYRHYCHQMKTVISSFEALAGTGAAKVYLALASRAMSMHFRCLRDGIVSQIHATQKAMEEKGGAIAPPGTTIGETPRLSIIDQALRQQRASQQLSLMDTHLWRPQRGLPEPSVSVLRAWLFGHFLHPYPSDMDKHTLARETGLSKSQVSNWFINARVRLWKPMIEEMYLEETKNPDDDTDHNLIEEDIDRQNQNRSLTDQKPIESHCLSSIISTPCKKEGTRIAIKGRFHGEMSNDMQQEQTSIGDFGGVDLGFSGYNYDNQQRTPDGVSLTLGLQQRGGGQTLAFPRAVGNYALLDGDDLAQNSPYRNLIGAQLFRDLAG